MQFDGIAVDHGALDTGAQDLIGTAKKIDGRLNDLEGELSPLKEQWHGSAKVAYDQAKAKWDQAIAEMILLLQDTGNAVSQSNQDYQSADKRGAGRFA